TTVAFSFITSTSARLNDTTARGSKPALRTSVRILIQSTIPWTASRWFDAPHAPERREIRCQPKKHCQKTTVLDSRAAGPHGWQQCRMSKRPQTSKAWMLRRFDIDSPEKWLSELRGFQINARTGVRLTGARRPLPFVKLARGVMIRRCAPTRPAELDAHVDVDGHLVGQLEALIRSLDLHQHVGTGCGEARRRPRNHSRGAKLLQQFRLILHRLAQATDGALDRADRAEHVVDDV